MQAIYSDRVQVKDLLNMFILFKSIAKCVPIKKEFTCCMGVDMLPVLVLLEGSLSSLVMHLAATVKVVILMKLRFEHLVRHCHCV